MWQLMDSKRFSMVRRGWGEDPTDNLMSFTIPGLTDLWTWWERKISKRRKNQRFKKEARKQREGQGKEREGSRGVAMKRENKEGNCKELWEIVGRRKGWEEEGKEKGEGEEEEEGEG